MNKVSDILKDFDLNNLSNIEVIQRKKKKELIDQFYEKIQECRRIIGMRPTNYVLVYSKLRHLELEDLKWFWSLCSKSNNFTKCFYGMLKTKK